MQFLEKDKKLKFKFFPTGNLYNREELINIKTKTLIIKAKNGVLYQENPSSLNEYKPKSGWIQSNEPEEHLDKIFLNIRKELKNINRILCFSYKDKSLADRFGKNSKIDFLYEEKAGLIGQFAEDSDLEFDLDNFKNIGNYDLVIIRHYLEHFKDPMAILDELSKVTSKKGFLYIEVPDTEQFVQKGNPLFLWEQHRFYFNKKSLLSLLFQGGYNIIFSSLEGKNIEPSICTLINRIELRKIEKQKSYSLSDLNLIKKINLGIKNYLFEWSEYFKKNENKRVLLGIGHNSDRFMQLTSSFYLFDYFVDQSKSKNGFYLAGTKRGIDLNIKINKKENFDIILGVHDRAKMQLYSKLKNEYPNASFYSVFNNPNKLINP